MPFHGRFEFTEKTRHKLLSQAVGVRLLSQANDLKRTPEGLAKGCAVRRGVLRGRKMPPGAIPGADSGD